MKKYTHTAFSLFLAAFVTLGLSACADGGGEGAVDTMSTNMDTATTPPQQDMESDMAGGPVSLQSTNELLTQGVAQIPAQQAVQNLNGWQEKLDGLQLEGQAQDAVSNISGTLGDLADTLEDAEGQPDAQAVGQAFEQLSTQLQTLLQNAQNLNLQGQQEQQLSQMQKAFQQASQQLMSGGGM